jgi:hypothetical protein
VIRVRHAVATGGLTPRDLRRHSIAAGKRQCLDLSAAAGIDVFMNVACFSGSFTSSRGRNIFGNFFAGVRNGGGVE